MVHGRLGTYVLRGRLPGLGRIPKPATPGFRHSAMSIQFPGIGASMYFFHCRAIVFLGCLSAAMATAQVPAGAGNRAAADLAQKSPIVQSAWRFLQEQSRKIADVPLRMETLDAIKNPEICIQH